METKSIHAPSQVKRSLNPLIWFLRPHGEGQHPFPKLILSHSPTCCLYMELPSARLSLASGPLHMLTPQLFSLAHCL